MNHKIAYAYRKQKFTKRPKNVLDAYYRRPLFDSEAWQKRSSTRPRTRQHTPNYKMTLSTRMDPSSPNYRIGSLNGYDNPIEFDYMQNEVNEHKRQQYRQEHNVEEEWEIERREQEAKRNPVISISPIKRRRKKKKRTTTRNKTNHQDQRNEDNSTTKSTHSTSSLQSKVIDPAKIKQRRAATRERKIKAIERLNKMAAPREQKVLANQEFRAKLKTKHLPPTQIAHLLHPNRVATPMSDKTLHWIEHASRAKEAKLQALEEFQLRLKETKMSPADRTHRQNQRPKTTLSPVRAAWCRTASKPRRIATPYVSPSISGAFGCSGTRFVGESEFTSKIGPGDYGIVDDPMTRSNTGACKFNLSVTKDVIDLAVFAKAGIPGPGKYGVCDNPNTITNAGGGKFNLSITMDTIDQAVFLRREVPGPGKYNASKRPNMGAVKFGGARGKSDLDRIILNSGNTPGPSDYVLPESSSMVGGGRFQMGDTPDFIEIAISRARSVPGLEYYPGKALDFLENKNGGLKISDAHTPDFIDQMLNEKKHVPGPGRYRNNDPRNSINNPNSDWSVNRDKIGS